MAKKVAIGNICSLMFLCVFLFLIMFFIEVKTCFSVFVYLQINVCNIYESHNIGPIACLYIVRGLSVTHVFLVKRYVVVDWRW